MSSLPSIGLYHSLLRWMNLHIEHESERMEYDRRKEKLAREVGGEEENVMKRNQVHPVFSSVEGTDRDKSEEGLL